MKVGGEWRALDMFLRVKGEWRPSVAVYVKENGEWKVKVHEHDLFSYVSDDLDTHSATCAYCGRVISEDHAYERVSVQPASCEVAGIGQDRCTKCGQEKIYSIDALRHDMERYFFTKDDLTVYAKYKCTRCERTEEKVFTYPFPPEFDFLNPK